MASRAAPAEGKCARCQTPTVTTCAKCRQRFYCSPVCQEKDWVLGHKSVCGGRTHPPVTERPTQPSLTLFPPTATTELMASELALKSKGLVNVGNTCYLNSLLQCLVATSPLTSHLLSLKHKGVCKRSVGCMACEMENFVLEMQEDSEKLVPKHIVATLVSLSKEIMLGRQEDSHQVLLMVLHALHDAFLQETAPAPTRMVDQETTLIHQLFGGVLASQLQCPDCGHASTTFESCLDLSLEIHEHTDTLAEMLEAFTVPERLDKDNKIKCAGCKADVRAYKQMSLFAAPNILSIQLKRFRMGFFGKVNKYIEFPTVLDLSAFMSDGTVDADVTYDLYGVLIHLDLFNISSFGHYVACVKGGDGKWRVFDDSQVEVISEATVLKQNPYMLFYKRRNPRAFTATAAPAAAAPASLLDDFRKDWLKELGKDAGPTAAATADTTAAPAAGAALAPPEAAPPAAPVSVPCEGGCGFFGSSAQHNLCSHCFKQRYPAEAAALAAVKAAEEKVRKEAEAAAARKAADEEALRMYIKAKEESVRRAEIAAKVAALQEQQKKAAAPPKVGRNDDCHCGSGKKFKKCHGK